MSIISTVANYGGKINDTEQTIKNFIESSNKNIALLIYKREDGELVQTLANSNTNFLIEKNLLVKNDLIVNGAIYNPSDIRLKNNINILDLEKIEKLSELKPISYKYNNDIQNKLHYGLIADDVEKLYPELIKNNSTGFKVLNYSELIPLLLAKIQIMDDQIKELKNKINPF